MFPVAIKIRVPVCILLFIVTVFLHSVGATSRMLIDRFLYRHLVGPDNELFAPITDRRINWLRDSNRDVYAIIDNRRVELRGKWTLELFDNRCLVYYANAENQLLVPVSRQRVRHLRDRYGVAYTIIGDTSIEINGDPNEVTHTLRGTDKKIYNITADNRVHTSTPLPMDCANLALYDGDDSWFRVNDNGIVEPLDT